MPCTTRRRWLLHTGTLSAALAVPGDRLTVWSNAADPATDLVAMEQLVGRGADQLRVVLLPNGGSFAAGTRAYASHSFASHANGSTPS